ncbi:MAG: NUDIX domain-containing protein [Chloroflexi bacterium]|nr:NUDIX domain-containing protein [Chloroflexota bacterium]
MRTRAGVVLIEDDKVALIERHRAGLDYYVFPGGGVDNGETPEQVAIREAREELGVEVAIKRKVAVIHFDQSTQIYFLAERLCGEFGSGTGEEFTDADPNDPQEGIYIPVWMPIEDLSQRENIYPSDLAALVVRSMKEGWAEEAVVIFESPRRE